MACRSGDAIVLGCALSALLLAACSTDPLSKETDGLDKAAAAFKAQTTAASPLPAAKATTAKAAMLLGLVQGNPRPLQTNCAAPLTEKDTALRAAVNKRDDKAADAAFKALLENDACGTAPAPAAKMDPLPVVAALNDYFDALQAIVAATDSKDVSDAAKTATTSVAALAKAAKAPAIVQAAPDFIDKLVNLALQDAQYQALHQVVLDIDPHLDAAAPAIIGALRVQQSFWIQQVAEEARTSTIALNSTLADPKVTHDPALELTVYGQAAPLLDQVASEQSAVATDPADAVRAMVKAHHKLAEALKSNKGQLKAVFGNIGDIAAGAKDLTSAGASKPAAGGKTGG